MTDIILDAMDVTNVEKESSLKRRRLEEDEATEVDSSSKPKAKKAQTLSYCSSPSPIEYTADVTQFLGLRTMRRLCWFSALARAVSRPS